MPWICVDAGIAAGKSTLLEALEREGVRVNKEPVGDPSKGERLSWDPFLDAMYGGVPGAAFSFQKQVVLDRALSEEAASIGVSLDKWGVMERSPDMQRLTFVRMGGLTDEEVDHIDSMYESAVWKPACIIYMRVPPDVSHARMVSRGRASEQGMGVDFHEKLHDLHEDAIEVIRAKGIPLHVIQDAGPEEIRGAVRGILNDLRVF